MADNTNPINDLFTEKLRPQKLSQAILVPRISSLLAAGLTNNFMFYGSPGCGKTTCTRILAKEYCQDYLYINASSDNGIDTIRNKVESYASGSSLFGNNKVKVVVLEECDRLTPQAWDAARATIEKFHKTVRFIANCNNFDNIPDAIRSRFNCIPFNPINVEEEEFLINAYGVRVKNIFTQLGISYTDDNVRQFVLKSFPDMRSVIQNIQALYQSGKKVLDLKDVADHFENEDLFEMIINGCDPVENYKALQAEWSSKVDDALQTIGKNFPDYLISKYPDKAGKLSQIIPVIATRQAESKNTVDKFISLSALVFNIQIILHS